MNPFHFEVPGDVVPKGRPRFSSAGGFVRAYTPAKTERYEDTIRYFASRQWGDTGLIEGVPVSVKIVVNRSVPTSWSGRKTDLALAGGLRPITKPDWDNYGKIVCDALNGVIWKDDSLIVACEVSKHFAASPCLQVTISW